MPGGPHKPQKARPRREKPLRYQPERRGPVWEQFLVWWRTALHIVSAERSVAWRGYYAGYLAGLTTRSEPNASTSTPELVTALRRRTKTCGCADEPCFHQWVSTPKPSTTKSNREPTPCSGSDAVLVPGRMSSVATPTAPPAAKPSKHIAVRQLRG